MKKKIDILCVALECRKEYIWNMFKYVQSLGFKEMERWLDRDAFMKVRHPNGCT